MKTHCSMPDYSIFANPAFDPNEYANAILAGEPYLPQAQQASKSAQTKTSEPLAKEDISVAISKLNFGIDDVSKQIKAVVSFHSSSLFPWPIRVFALNQQQLDAFLAGTLGEPKLILISIRCRSQPIMRNSSRKQPVQIVSQAL